MDELIIESSDGKYPSAYYDSFQGLIPVKITGMHIIDYPFHRTLKIRAIVTGRKLPAGWKRGELLDSAAFHFFRRQDIYVRHGIYHAINFDWMSLL